MHTIQPQLFFVQRRNTCFSAIILQCTHFPRGCAQLGVPLGGPGSGWVLSSGCFSPVGVWVLRLGVWFGVHSQYPWWLLVCGAGGDAGCDAGCDAGSGGASGAPLCRVGAIFWCRCTWVCAVLGACRRGVAGCYVLCFLVCACLPMLTVCMLCSSYLNSGLFCALPDADSALCLVLHCTAPLDVSKSHFPNKHPSGTLQSKT